MDVSVGESVVFRDAGQVFGTYHHRDAFKSYFRGLCTPQGRDVVGVPPRGHPHHKGLQFGLCASDVNFWEEHTEDEPEYRRLPIGRQQTTRLDLLPPGEGVGFLQEVRWATDTECTFLETRRISVEAAPGAYVWTWRTTLTAQRDVDVITSVWNGPGYCGLGLRLACDLFLDGTVVPALGPGAVPASVSFRGRGAAVTFQQDAARANALFVSRYDAGKGCTADEPFAFLSLGPTNAQPRSLRTGETIQGSYVVTVADG